MERILRPPGPLDLHLTLAPLQRGPHDPTFRWIHGAAHRATRTPEGPVSMVIEHDGDRVALRAWGPGAAWTLAHAPALLGFEDDPDAFDTPHPVVRRLNHSLRGLRMARTGTPMHSLVRAIVEQRVTTIEASRTWSALARALGGPAPGQLGLCLPPDPDRLAELPYWALHRFGLERRRADTLRRACALASRIERAHDAARAYALMRSVHGVGAWTVAEVARDAYADPDCVSVGDYNLKHIVAWVLAGEPRATDERMLELLEPFRGRRARAVRLIEASGWKPPRYGPRIKLRSIARI